MAIAGYPDRDRIMMSELAERLQVRHHTTVELIDRLAAQDLVVREPGMEDRRQVYVSLTERGKEVLARLTATHREELRRVGPQLNLLLDQLSAIGEPDAPGWPPLPSGLAGPDGGHPGLGGAVRPGKRQSPSIIASRNASSSDRVRPMLHAS